MQDSFEFRDRRTDVTVKRINDSEECMENNNAYERRGAATYDLDDPLILLGLDYWMLIVVVLMCGVLVSIKAFFALLEL